MDDIDPERPVTGHLSPPQAVPATGERFVELLALRGVVVEEILSSDSPADTRYVQEQDEWVLLLDGRAELEVDGVTVTLQGGDHLLLPAGTPHRVLATAQGTRWLAVHIPPPTTQHPPAEDRGV